MSEQNIRVLLIGRGGRESALAWKLSKSKIVERIFVVPGNGGTAQCLEKVSNIDGIDEEDFPRLVELALDMKISLVVLGPDAPIVNGIKAHFEKVCIIDPDILR